MLKLLFLQPCFACKVDTLDIEEDTAASQHPEEHAHSSYSTAADGAIEGFHSQLPASFAAPLLRRAGHLEPDSHDSSHSTVATSTAVSVPAGTQQQDEVGSGAGVLHGGSSGNGGSASGGRGRSGRHQDLTELHAQVGYPRSVSQQEQ